MKRFIEGQSREQVTLLPECLDDFVGVDNPVRIVDAFVEELDLPLWALMGQHSGHRPPGLPPCCTAQGIHLRVSQPHPIQSPPGA